MSPEVVVIGGGFAALEVSLALRKLRPNVSVTVVSDATEVTYRPWLIKVPAGGQPPPQIPFANLLAAARIEVVSERATGIDLSSRLVTLQSGTVIAYHQLVIATGAVADRNRVPGARAHALFPCDLADAGEFAAAVSSSPSTIAVVFGWERPGPGLEYAAWIAAHRPGSKVTAIDGDGTLQRRFGEKATARIQGLLERRGGRLLSQGPVVRIDAGAVQLGARTVAADVIALATPLTGETGWLPRELIDARGMLKVDSSMAAAPGVFGIGDVVAVPANYRLSPTLQSIQSTSGGVARNVVRALDGGLPLPVLRTDRPDLLGPDLAGAAVFVRDRRLVMSGRIPLLIRSFMDRSYLRRRRAHSPRHPRLAHASDSR